MIQLPLKHSVLIAWLLIISTDAQNMPNPRPHHKHRCFHNSAFYNILNYLEHCAETINANEEKTYRIPHYKNPDPTCNEFANKQKTLNIFHSSLVHLRNEYNYLKRGVPDCSPAFCHVTKMKPHEFYYLFKDKNLFKEKRVEAIKDAPLSIQECISADQLANYFVALLNLWGNFSVMNRLFHIDGKFFRATRNAAEKNVLESTPKCLKTTK